MKFVDRIEELRELDRVLNLKNASFVVIYGRRRLGKSTLIKKSLHKEDVFFMAGDFMETVQLDLLKESLAVKFPELTNINFRSWEDLLIMVNKLSKEKFTLCLDEFPYMVKHSPELPSVLQRLIDSKELKYNIIICGSSQRMMQNLILSHSEPLYGRANGIFNLQPIPISFMREALHLDAVACVEEYGVWGGIPRYWELREEYPDLMESIKGLLLSTVSVLYDEPRRLFLDDMTSSVQSESLMSVIAAGANRLSEIAARMGREATALSAPLDRLIQMNYIRREIPFGENPKKSKKSLYKISDPFMRFYYSFIIPNLSNIGRGRKDFVVEEIENRMGDYIANYWEFLCREAISGNKLYGSRWKEASRWWGSIKRDNEIIQTEIDVVAESADGEAILIGECKWTNPEIASVLIRELEKKISILPFCQGKRCIPVLFLKNKPKDLPESSQINILYPEDIIRLV